MSVFDRFTNPVWHAISRLDDRRQRIAAFLITGYGSCRYNVNEYLVAPLNQKGMLQLPIAMSPQTRERLIDEALVGLLKSCKVPQSDPSGRIPGEVVQNVAEVWGLFALADSNHRLNRAKPDTLKDSLYSSDPDEARTQVLVKWAEILGLNQSDFVMDANRHWFLEQWSSMTAAMIAGFLTGFARTPDEIVLKKARSEAASIPEHRLVKARYMVERLATAPLSPHQGVNPQSQAASTEPRRVPDFSDRASNVIPAQRRYKVEERPDGKATINLAPNAKPLDFIRAMVVMMQPRLVAKDAEVCTRWVSIVTGTAAAGSQWKPAHVDALVNGFERFYWDGEGNNAWLTELIRKEYPEVKGSPIDVKLTDDIRTIFRRWTANG